MGKSSLVCNDVGVENLVMARWWDSNIESYDS